MRTVADLHRLTQAHLGRGEVGNGGAWSDHHADWAAGVSSESDAGDSRLHLSGRFTQLRGAVDGDNPLRHVFEAFRGGAGGSGSDRSAEWAGILSCVLRRTAGRRHCCTTFSRVQPGSFPDDGRVVWGSSCRAAVRDGGGPKGGARRACGREGGECRHRRRKRGRHSDGGFTTGGPGWCGFHPIHVR